MQFFFIKIAYNLGTYANRQLTYLQNQIDILDWVTYPPTETLGYLNLGDVREMHQCVLMPKGIMGHPTVAIGTNRNE